MRLRNHLFGIGPVTLLYRWSRSKISCEENEINKSNCTGEYVIQANKESKSIGDDLYIVFDARTRCPKYAVEKLFRSSDNQAGEVDGNVVEKKRPPFHPEPSIRIESFRVSSE